MNSEIIERMAAVASSFSRISGLYTRWAQKQGISPYMVCILYLLLTDEMITQKRICEEFEIPKQSIYNIVTGMKQDGYITMKSSEVDRREKSIVLTKTGLDYAMEVLTPIMEIEEATLGLMGSERMEQLVRLNVDFADLLELQMTKSENAKNTK